MLRMISVDEFIEDVQRLKLGKSDGEEGLNSNHIIHGPKILFVLLAFIFNSMLVCGFSRLNVSGNYGSYTKT